MKVAISIPNPLFKSAENLAKKLNKPRSRLYAEALANYVWAQDPQAITDNLNEVYGKIESGVDPVLERLQAETLDSNETW
jgi:predicted transcriptional regulator